MRFFRAILTSVFSLSLLFLLNTRMGQVPPLGKFLDPFRGFWQNAEPRTGSISSTISLAGIKGAISVVFDDKMIPHIFAKNDNDLYFAQGYITAKNRLWQMDVQTRLAAGRLSEVLGKDLLETDRFQRRMGMGYGAEKMMAETRRFPRLKAVLQAYANGVNAYISTLSPKDYPIEFKILDYAPERWEMINSALLLKMMSATLAGGSDEFYMNNILRRFGPAVTRDLFPDQPYRSDPVIPAGTKWNFTPVPVPPVPGPALAAGLATLHTRQREEGIGSNNWAVSGTKTASGYPILENDPHLDLTLPSIWYQVQLTAPGVNVYGVSIPGSPCVIIGYNQQVAWGVTNVGADVLDWYRIQFRDASKKEYWYAGKWNPVKPRIEHITIRGAGEQVDTVMYTHQGPVVYEDHQKPRGPFKTYVPEGHALRWIAHDPSTDIETFYLLNRAKNYTDYRAALACYTAPAQNFAFADMANDIAITSNGRFPLKWKEQGKFLLDGSKPENDWQGFIPAAQNPTVKNPERGFISSANQFLADPTYPYYINWDYAPYERAHRINQRLAAMNRATPDSLRNLQNDTYSVLAGNILPLLLHALNREKLDATQNEAYSIVSSWKKFYNPHETGASIFERWQTNLQDLTWDEFIDSKYPMRFPSRDRTVELLLNDPGSKWFDKRSTPATRETRDDIINEAFKMAVDSLLKRYGPISPKWEWGSIKQSHVPHLAGFPGFGSAMLDIGGTKSVVNATLNKNGPSWRMIVALGKPVKGYGVFPGGESGNPGSYYYDNMISTWAAGKLNDLLYLNTPDEKNKRIIGKLTITH